MGLVGLLETFVGHVEGVGVLHDEFASTEDASAGALFIAILGLDLIKGDGEIFIGVVFTLDQGGEDLFVCGAE